MADQHTKFQRDVQRQMLVDHELSHLAFRIGFYLVDQIRRTDNPEAGLHRGECRMSHQALAKMLGVSERSVRYATAELKTRGHFAVAESPWRGGLGRGLSNRYKPILKDDPQGSLPFDNIDENGNEPANATIKSGTRLPASGDKAGKILPASRGARILKQAKSCRKAGSILPVETSVPSVDRQTDGNTDGEREGSPPFEVDGGAPDGRTVTKEKQAPLPATMPNEPTDTMIAFAIEKGWEEKRTWDEFDHFKAHFEEHPDRMPANLEKGWASWVTRGLKWDRERGERQGSRRNSVPLYIAVCASYRQDDD